MAREAAKKVEDFQTKNTALVSDNPSSTSPSSSSPNRKVTELLQDTEKEQALKIKNVASAPDPAVTSEDHQALNPSLASRDPSSVSKEELIEILQKMNKRVKALAAVKMQLVDRVKTVEDDKSRLVELVKSEILNNVDLEAEFGTQQDKSVQQGDKSEDMDEIKMIQMAWRAIDERNQLALQQLQNEYKEVSKQCQEQVEKVKKEAQDEINVQVEKKMAAWITSNGSAGAGAEGNGGSDDDDRLRECKQELHKAKEDMLRLETKMEEMASKHSLEVETIVNKHEENVNQMKKEAEEDKAKSIAKLKEMVKEKLIAMKTSYEEKIRSLSEQIATGDDASHQATLDTMKIEHEKEMNDLKVQLDEASAQIKDYEQQLVSVRDELQVSHQAELNDLKENFVLKEKEWKLAIEEAGLKLEKERSSINDRIQEALEGASNNRQMLESEKIEASQQEFESKLNEMKTVHEQELVREKSEVVSLLQKVDEIKASHEKNIQSLKESHEQNMERVVNELQEKAKQDLMEMETSYETKITSLNEQVTQINDEFQIKISELKSEHETAINQTATAAEKEAADKYAKELASAREELEKSHRDNLETMKDDLLEEKNKEIQRLKEEATEKLMTAIAEESDKLSMIKQDYEVKINDLQTVHDDEVKSLRSETTRLSARIQEIEAAHSKELEAIKIEAQREINIVKMQQTNENRTEVASITTELELKHENEIRDICKKHEEEIIRIRAEHSASLDALAQVAGEETKQLHREEVNKITEQLQQSHLLEMEKLKSDIDNLKTELKERLSEAYEEGERSASQSEQQTITSIQKSCEDRIMKLQSVHENELIKVTDETKSLSCRLQDLETAHSKEISLLNEEHAKQLNAIRSDLEEKKAISLAEMKQETEDNLVTLKSSYEEKLSCAFHTKEIQVNLEAELRKNDELTKQYSDLLLSFTKTEEINQSLERRLSEIEIEHSKSIDALKKKCERLEEEKMTFSVQMAQMEKTIDSKDIHRDIVEQLEKDLMTTKANVDQLSRELKDESELLLAANRNIDELKETIQSLRAENSSLSELNIQLENEVNRISDSLEHVQAEASLKDESFKKQTEESEELRALVEKGKEEVSTLMKSHQNDIASLQEEVTDARETLKRIKEEHKLELYNFKEENAKSVEMACKDVARVREEYRHQISVEQQKYNEMISAYELRLKNLQSEMDDALKSAEDLKEASKLKLIKAEEERKILIDEHENALSTLKGEIAAINAQKIQFQIQDEGHKTGMMELTTQYEAKISELERSIESEKDVAEVERKRFLEKIASLEKLVSESSSSIDIERDRIKNEAKSYYDEKLKDILDENDVKKKEIIDKLTTKFNEKLQAAIDEHEKVKSDLKDKMAHQTDDLRVHFEQKMNKMKAEFETINSQLEAEKVDMLQKISTCEAKLLSVQEDRDTLKHQVQVEITAATKLQNLLDASKKELLDCQRNSEAAANSLLIQQEKMKSDLTEFEEKVRDLQKELSTKTRQNEELVAKLTSLQQSLNELCNQKKQMEERLEVSSKQVLKLNAMEKELEKSREELNSFRLELSQKSALLSRLQAEQEASEKTHGQRTAIVGMLETQISELNETNIELQAKLEAATYDLRQKDDDLQNASADIDQLRNELDGVKGKLQIAMKNLSERNSKFISEEDMQEKATLVSSLQTEILSLQQQMAKKSSTAQRLLQQCEAECQELKNRNKKLQRELDKGSFSEQRIFELAAQQSNQESLVTSEINIRNQMVERLAEKLQRHDDELASTEYTNKQIEKEVEELSRIHRREDVNLDYLKSTIVQFLSKPPGSSERVALLPVIATLLQFDSDDYKLIEQGKAKVSWFGSVLPTVITSPDTEGSAVSRSTLGAQSSPLLPQSVSSAEVTVADRNPNKRVSRTSGTSLQF